MEKTQCCSKCITTKPLSEFYPAKGNRLGVQRICKLCRKEEMRVAAIERRKKAKEFLATQLGTSPRPLVQPRRRNGLRERWNPFGDGNIPAGEVAKRTGFEESAPITPGENLLAKFFTHVPEAED